jgi:hypothetical protein
MSRSARMIPKLSILFAAVLLAETVGVPKPDISALWVPLSNLESRDLFHGAGGKKNAPRTTAFTFVEEDTGGTAPKLIVTDADGVHWKMKFGPEAKPETAASRFVWAAGFYTHQIYFLPNVRVAELPEKVHRGGKWIGPDGSIQDVRMLRLSDREKKVGDWKWRKSPFADTREFNGLRVLMAVINNWDLLDRNTAIYEGPNGRRKYMVSDLGGTFGTTGITWHKSKWKGDIEAYQKSKFIKSATPELISFANPARPAIAGAIAPANFIKRHKMRWIGKDIPREHARWMGQLLGRLSPSQIRDAFHASGFTAEESELFAEIVESRIAQLKAL